MDANRATLEFAWGPVSYLEWRPESEPRSTVVLLHGGGVDSASLSWGEFGRELASAGHRVLAPDHPGYGQSPLPPWPASQERLVDYVGEFVDALELERYAIGGLSLGGGMTIGHVLARPERVTGAILMGAYGLMDNQYEGWWAVPAHVLTWAMLRTGLLGAIMSAYGRNRRLMDSSLKAIVRNPAQLTPELRDEAWAAAQRDRRLTAFGQWQRDQFGLLHLRTNYTERLGRFPRPALVIHGDRDSGVPVARARIAAERIPDSQLLVVSDAGHWIQRDRPDLVAPAVLEFLDRLSAPGR